MKPGNRFLTSAVFVLSALIQTLAQSAEAKEISVNTHTRAGPFSITVRFKDGKTEWAQAVADESPNYIRQVERYMNSPVPWTKYMIIEGCDDCTSRAVLQEHKIYLNYTFNPVDNVSVLFHEIDHFWFYYFRNRSSEEWLIEGISSFLPNAMRDRHLLPDTSRYHGVLDRHWGLDGRLSSSVKDVPLYPFNEGKRNLLYMKSYKLQYLFYCLLGQEKYRSFVRKITSIHHRAPSLITRILRQYRKENWRKILRGWVQGRTYRRVSLSDFTEDDDSDGLVNAKEACFRTKPEKYDTDLDLLPDGAEVSLGRNPRRKDADGLAVLLKSGPFADGSAAEWEYFDARILTDSSGDENGPEWSDMIEMRSLVKDDSLHVIVNTALRLQTPEDVFFDILVDSDNDGWTEEEFAFFLNNPAYPWEYTDAGSATLSGLKAAAGDNMEMTIPLSAIPSQSFRILPIIRNNGTKKNYDEWGEWVLIETLSSPLSDS